MESEVEVVEEECCEVQHQCPICNGPMQELGMLACMMHYRCRCCGMMTTKDEGGCG